MEIRICCISYGNDVAKMKEDFLNVRAVIPKELITGYLNSQCKLAFPVKVHDGFHDLNIVIELD